MHAALLELTSPAIPDAREVMGRTAGENFPVATRALSRHDRRHLLAIYGFARLADELGDALVGDRLAALDWLHHEVERAYAGDARHPLLRALAATIAECKLPRAPLLRLIEANRVDQRVARYETWEQLRSYCALSANPVGELLLCVFGRWSPARVTLSDRVCTALQLVEHLQDVREDVRRGRIYLPAEDLARFGCSHEDLTRLVEDDRGSSDERAAAVSRSNPRAGHGEEQLGRLRETIEFEAGRARELLGAGAPLVASIAGRPKLAVAAFVAGGRAALQAIEHARFDVLDGVPRASRPRRLRMLVDVLADSRSAESGA
jgi:squalene synthase HpnC